MKLAVERFFICFGENGYDAVVHFQMKVFGDFLGNHNVLAVSFGGEGGNLSRDDEFLKPVFIEVLTHTLEDNPRKILFGAHNSCGGDVFLGTLHGWERLDFFQIELILFYDRRLVGSIGAFGFYVHMPDEICHLRSDGVFGTYPDGDSQ